MINKFPVLKVITFLGGELHALIPLKVRLAVWQTHARAIPLEIKISYFRAVGWLVVVHIW